MEGSPGGQKPHLRFGDKIGVRKGHTCSSASPTCRCKARERSYSGKVHGVPSTLSVRVCGGVAPYTYSWTGSDGLSGSGSSIIKIYGTSGQKSAIVTVTSADGKTGTRACSNTLAVGRPAGSYVARATTNTTVTTPVVNSNQTNNGQSAAALFSLQSVPWGWVAILVILVLFATVLYLIFNRPKI